MHILDFLHLPSGKRCIFGGKALQARGLRNSQDRDILVDQATFEILKNQFPKALSHTQNSKDPYLSFPELHIEIFKNLPGFAGKETKILQKAELIKGIPYMTIEDLIDFKKQLNRPKDLEDIKLLMQYKNQI